MKTIHTDVAIIGAGPAAAIAATYLCQQGRKVHCFERIFFPRFVIGESLLPRCNQLLAEVGMLEDVTKRNYMVKPGALFLRGEERQRFTFAEGLPGDYPDTYQVPRDDFDQCLATTARARGAIIQYGCEVKAVDFDDQRARMEVFDHETNQTFAVESEFLIDCSGYGRVLPRLLDLEAPSELPPRVAVFAQVEGDIRPADPKEAGEIWICVHPDNGWMWIIPFANGRTSVGAIVDQPVWDAMEGSLKERWEKIIYSEPNAAERLKNAMPGQPVRKLDTWSVKVKKMYGDRWAVSGNAGDFLDPIFSSGVMLALESGLLTAKAVEKKLKGEPVDFQVEYVDEIQRGVRVFREFVTSWYDGRLPDIFFSKVYPPRLKSRVTSILGGNALREDNALVLNTAELISQIHSALKFKLTTEFPNEIFETRPISQVM